MNARNSMFDSDNTHVDVDIASKNKKYGFSCVLIDSEYYGSQLQQDCIEFNFIVKGSLSYTNNDIKSIMHPGCCFLILGASNLLRLDMAPDTAYYSLRFRWDDLVAVGLPFIVLDELVRDYCVIQNARENYSIDKGLFEQWVDRLAHEDEEVMSVSLLEIKARLLRFIIDVYGSLESHAGQVACKSRVAEKYFVHISENYDKQASLKELAEQIGIQPSYATRHFIKQYGISAVKYLMLLRISHAKYFLATTCLSITDIAYRSGFQSVARFNSAFKLLSQTSPSRYRKQCQQKRNLNLNEVTVSVVDSEIA